MRGAHRRAAGTSRAVATTATAAVVTAALLGAAPDGAAQTAAGPATSTSPTPSRSIAPNLWFTATAARSTCAGADSSITATATWGASQTHMTYSITAAGQTKTYTVAKTSGTDTWTFRHVPAGHYPVVFASASNAVARQVVVCPTALTATLARTRITYGGHTTITTRLTDATSHAAVPGAPLVLYGRPAAGGTWTRVASATTGSTGSAGAAINPRHNTTYQWRYAGSPAHASANSPARTLSVRQAVTLRSTRSQVLLNSRVTLWGVVSPARSGATVYLQRGNAAGTEWSTVATVRLALQKLPDGTTRVGFAKRVVVGGNFWRAVTPRTGSNAAGISGRLVIGTYVP